jgi:hypothetical protein
VNTPKKGPQPVPGAGLGLKGLENAAASGLNESFHVIEVTGESFPPVFSEPVFGFRHAAFERFAALHVAGFFELAGMDAEIAVGCIEQLLEIVERDVFIRREGADDPEADPFVNDTVQRRGALRSRGRRRGFAPLQT